MSLSQSCISFNCSFVTLWKLLRKYIHFPFKRKIALVITEVIGRRMFIFIYLFIFNSISRRMLKWWKQHRLISWPLELQNTHYFFFFFTCPHKRGGWIRTSDLRFIKRGPQLIELSLGTKIHTTGFLCQWDCDHVMCGVFSQKFHLLVRRTNSWPNSKRMEKAIFKITIKFKSINFIYFTLISIFII
jgi:hypothetical protein